MSVKLRREQLALAEQEGLLLERAQAERDLFNIFRELRDRHDVIARRIAPELATTASTEACEIVLQRAYQRLLTETIAALAISVLGQETATRLELVPTYQ